jgi:DNA (cytosine-5)-methyltransferase 1
MADGYCWTCGEYLELPFGHLCGGCMNAWYDTRSRGLAEPEVIADLCCGAGGAARGMSKAGHYVIGVDTNAKLRDDYLRSGAAEFVHASITDVLADTTFLRRITFAWVSPPCQHFSRMCRCRPELRERYPDLITPSRPLLDAWGGLYVIENVSGARPWMKNPVCVCMWMWGRETYRHRLLEAGGGLALTPPRPPAFPSPGTRIDPECGWPHPFPASKAGHWGQDQRAGKRTFVSVSGHELREPVQRVMEAGWMRKREDVAESIPWYMAAWVMDQLAAWREAEAAA